jgi:2-keto-4-pentenoate hydratase/2-oxohepta-3-ene-1,7-dioic acid hydratase in catechol pathway
MGLEPGDVISTGTPAGVAAFRTPPDPWWLKKDDEVRCEAAGIGELVNPVVASV